MPELGTFASCVSAAADTLYFRFQFLNTLSPVCVLLIQLFLHYLQHYDPVYASASYETIWVSNLFASK
jgi:hypothetical protein